MGLLRGMARTAVVAGTATSVSNRVSRRQAKKWNAQEEQEAAAQAPQQQQYYEQPPAYQEPEVDPTTAQLQQLAELQRQGIITQEEFTAKKKQVLGI